MAPVKYEPTFAHPSGTQRWPKQIPQTHWKPFQKYLLHDWNTQGSLDLLATNAGKPQPSVLSPQGPGKVGGLGLGIGGPGPGAGEEPGILSRIFASLDAPQNAVMNTFQALTTDNPEKQGFEEFASDLWTGAKATAAAGYQISPLNALIGGKVDDVAAKLNPANSVSKQLARLDYFDEHPWQREILGFAGDVATDPLTYVPFAGLGKLAARGLERAGIKAAKVTSEDVLKATADRAGMEASEDIVAPALKGERPVVKSNPTDVSDDIGVLDPIRHDNIINRRPTRSHLDDLTNALDEPAFTHHVLDDAVVQNKIGTALGDKIGEERTFLLDDDLGKATAKVKPEETAPHAMETGLRHSASFDEAVANGLDPSMASVHTLSRLYYEFLGKAQQRFLAKSGKKSLTQLEKVKSHDEALTKLRQAEDTIAQKNLELPADSTAPRFKFETGGVPMRLSHAIGQVPVEKADDLESVKNLVADFTENRIHAESHEVLKDFGRVKAAQSILKHPEFMPRFAKNFNAEKARAIAKDPNSWTDHVVKKAAQEKAMKKTMKDMGMKGEFGGHPGEANKIADVMMKHLHKDNMSSLEKAYKDNIPNHNRGITSMDVINSSTRQLEKDFGKPLRDLHDSDGTPRSVVASILGRKGSWLAEKFTTWHGQMGLDRPVKSYVMHALQVSRARLAKAKYILEKSAPEDIRTAFELMQKGHGPEAMTDEVQKAYGALQGWMDHLMGSSDIDKIGVVQRSQALKEDVNRELDRLWGIETKKLRFTDKKVTDKNGRVWDFSADGADGGWTQSWKAWDIDELIKHKRIGNPSNMLFDIDLALTSRSSLYAAIQDAGARFGRFSKSDDFQHKVVMRGGKEHPMLADKHFTPEVKQALDSIIEHYEKGSFAPNGEFGRFYQKALRAWKSGVTIYNPSHHIRNFFGDMWMTWMAGYSNPYDFYRGMKVMNAFRKNYHAAIKGDSWDDLLQFSERGLRGEPGSTIFRIGKQNVTANNLYQGMYQRGILIDINDLEDIGREGVDDFFRPERVPITHGRIRKAATQMGMFREHTVRAHHFTAATRKFMKKGMPLEKAMDKAAFEVRKWHPDGTDLTYFEQKWMRNVFPFYSWTRKAIPLIAEGLWKKPAKVLAYPRAQYGISSAMGFQEGNDKGLLDPFPESDAYPEWMRAFGVGPIGEVGAGGLSGLLGGLGEAGQGNQFGKFGTTIIDPGGQGIPFNSLIGSYFGTPTATTGGVEQFKQGLIGAGNPIARVGMELLQGHQTIGGDITGPQGYKEYAAKQIPITATLGSLFPGAFPWTSQKNKDKYGNVNRENLINWFTAAGIQGTGQYRGFTEFEAKDRAAKAKKNAAK